MKTLLILSDTHGSLKGIEKLKKLFFENDFIVHLGDGATDLRTAFGETPENAYLCKGNCDFLSPLPDEGVLDVEQVRILYCHGHTYGVKSSLVGLAFEAKRRGCDIALYGHTHQADITEIDGVTLINPGSLRYSAGEGGSYCYLVIHKDKITPVIVGESVG